MQIHGVDRVVLSSAVRVMPRSLITYIMVKVDQNAPHLLTRRMDQFIPPPSPLLSLSPPPCLAYVSYYCLSGAVTKDELAPFPCVP